MRRDETQVAGNATSSKGSRFSFSPHNPLEVPVLQAALH
jgi:hypothetical protein